MYDLVKNDTQRLRLALLSIGYIYFQTVSIHLSQTELELPLDLLLDVEQIFCFAPVQNSRNWINASRPLRIVPHVQDLFKPSYCKTLGPRMKFKPSPELVIIDNSYKDRIIGTFTKNETEKPLHDKRKHVECQSNYPMELLHTSVYRNPGAVSSKRDGKYMTEHIKIEQGNISDKVVYKFSTYGFNLRAENLSHFFRCQSIQNPCLHRSFQFFPIPLKESRQSPNQSFSGKEEQLMIRRFPAGGKGQTLKTELGRPANYTECQVLFFYREIPDFPGYEFRCEFPLERRGTINFHYCDSMNDCSNTLRNRKQSPKCWRKVEAWTSCGSDCKTRKASGFRPFVATCSFDWHKYELHWSDENPQFQESTLGGFAVFGLSRKPEEMPSIHFSEEEIDPRRMTILEPIDPYQFVGTNLTFTCRVSAFFNSAKYTNFQIVKSFANRGEMEVVKAKSGGMRQAILSKEWHHWSLTMTIDLGNDKDLSHIFCIGLHWKRSNSSRKIHLHAPKFPEIALDVMDSEGKGVAGKKGEILPAVQERQETFPLLSTNVSLLCHGFGYPPPEVSWTTTAANKPQAESTVVGATKSSSRIFFPVVDVGVEGTYICSAKNKLGDVYSSIRVGIKYPVSKAVVILSSVGSFILLILIIALICFLHRIRKLKQILRDLSDEEVKMFVFGDKTLDPTDANAEIYALAYDRSLEISPDSIEIDEKSSPLGAGEFGIVRPGFLKSKLNPNSNSNGSENDNRVPVAIKMPKFNVTTENFKSFLYEIKIMSFVQDHENVLKILGASTITIKKRQALIALEFCELGNLINFLRDKKQGFRNEFEGAGLTQGALEDFSETSGGYGDPWISLPKSERLETTDLLNFSLGIANGMNFLAEKKVIHGDLAARNILLARNREVKISDFGFSTQLKHYETYAKTNSLSIPWRWFPIEALVDRKFSLKSDCWSFGILLYEIFSLGQVPYAESNFDAHFVQRLREGYRNERPEFADEDVFKLMTECWQKDPNERPSFKEICERILVMSSGIVWPKLNLI